MTLFLLVPAASASAAPEVGIADDRIMLTGGAEADEAVAEWKSLGIDNVRVIAHWGLIAPGTTARSAPAGFDADDPNEPLYRWNQLDQAVARVRRAGMTVTLLVTGPGPLWSSSVPGKRIRAYKPRPAAYAAYAEAVARRYGSAVDRYLLWNEPNLNRWLAPQSRCKRGKCTPVSPHTYRGLVRAGYKAIDDHDPGAEIVVGSLGPRGKVLRRWSSTMAPQLFLRRFGCRTDAYKRIRTAECRRFTRATIDGFAVHPYSFRAPEIPNPGRDDVSIAQLPRLISTLDRLPSK